MKAEISISTITLSIDAVPDKLALSKLAKLDLALAVRELENSATVLFAAPPQKKLESFLKCKIRQVSEIVAAGERRASKLKQAKEA